MSIILLFWLNCGHLRSTYKNVEICKCEFTLIKSIACYNSLCASDSHNDDFQGSFVVYLENLKQEIALVALIIIKLFLNNTPHIY